MPNANRSARTRLRSLAGGVLILVGLWYLLAGMLESPAAARYARLGEEKSLPLWLTELNPHYQPTRVERFSILPPGSPGFQLDSAHYHDEKGQTRTAIFYPPIGNSTESRLRMDLWREVGAAIIKHVPTSALFVTWWDNAQRLNFLTGKETWIDGPDESAFPEMDARKFWRQAAGGFRRGPQNAQLARWYAMDAERAQFEMTKVLPKQQAVYFLASLDDLARLSEIEALSGTTLPFEVRIFPQSGNVHNQIAAVRRWAGDGGSGSYLVQQLPDGGVRAWRITTEAGTNTLFARLLPFTSSLMKPLGNHKLIYQSRWGAYLSVYQWRP